MSNLKQKDNLERLKQPGIEAYKEPTNTYGGLSIDAGYNFINNYNFIFPVHKYSPSTPCPLNLYKKFTTI